MIVPNDGRVHERHGPFIRNAQPIGGDVFLVEWQRGAKGKGKTWYMGLVRRHPQAGQVCHPQYPAMGTYGDWDFFGHAKLGQSAYRGDWKVNMWAEEPGSTTGQRRWLEAYFNDSMTAIQFMVRNAVEFLK